MLKPLPRKFQDSKHISNSIILIRNVHVWTPDGIRQESILIRNGEIEKIAKNIVSQSATETIDGARLVAIPGLVDAHVHLRDLELSYKEDFTSGTAAAAAGGFTTVLDMPNTKPPTDSAERLVEKQARAQDRIHVNVGFHAAAVEDPAIINGLSHGGAFSLKLYMPRPISMIDVENDETLMHIMKTASKLDLPLTVHAEDPDFFLEEPAQNFYDIARFRRLGSETVAVNRIIELQEESGCRTHFCHVTLASSIEKINMLRSRKLSSEVTPHHLLLSDKILRRAKWKAWMVPPLRPNNVRQELYNATMHDQVTLIASDHAPHTLKEKEVPPAESAPGIPGLETTLPLLLTLFNKGQLVLSEIIRLLSVNPRRVFGLSSHLLRPRQTADIVLLDLKKKSKVDSSKFFSKAKYSPFDGFPIHGAVHSTIVNGNLVFSQGEMMDNSTVGRVLKRNDPV